MGGQGSHASFYDVIASVSAAYFAAVAVKTAAGGCSIEILVSLASESEAVITSLKTSNVIWPSPSSTRIFSICAQHDRHVFVSARSALDRSPPPTHAIVTRARAHADMYALAHLVRRNIAGLKRTPKLGGVNCATYKRFADGVIKVQSRASCRLGPRETNCH